MNGKLIHNFDPANLILKPPSGTFSEIWYLDNTTGKSIAVRPIFKTPRLPLKFGAKRYADQTAYGYCLNMSNKDIDPEIGEFYQLVKQVDRALIAAFTEKHKSWPTKPTTCMKYRTAMKRKTVNDDFYFQIKLVHNKGGGPLATVIYEKAGKQAPTALTVGPEAITYGKYADQFICPAYLYYDDQGIHPVWQAHQIVLSTVERVFLEECILDHIFKPARSGAAAGSNGKAFAAFEAFEAFEPPAAPPPPPAQIRVTDRLTINPLELKSVIQNLKKPRQLSVSSSSSDDD
jgi:hypothetical protein